MQISDKKLISDFHMKEAVKFNKFHIFFKFAYHLSPFLLFFWIYQRSIWVIVGICLFALVSWLLSVKTKSLRNINYYASKSFKSLHDKDMIEIFK